MVSNKLKVYLTAKELRYYKETFGRDFGEGYDVVLMKSSEQLDLLERLNHNLTNLWWTANLPSRTEHG